MKKRYGLHVKSWTFHLVSITGCTFPRPRRLSRSLGRIAGLCNRQHYSPRTLRNGKKRNPSPTALEDLGLQGKLLRAKTSY